MVNALTIKNTVILLILAFMEWVFVVFGIFFYFFGASFVTSASNVFYLILGVISLLILISLDFLGDTKKSNIRVWGYLQDSQLSPLRNHPYWKKAYRILLVLLLLTLPLAYIGILKQASVIGSVAQAIPDIIEIDKVAHPYLYGLSKVAPPTLVELLVTGLVMSLVFTLIRFLLKKSGVNSEGVILVIAGFIIVIVIGLMSYAWHKWAYQADAGALGYVTMLFAVGALLIILTGGLIAFDIPHIINNYVLGMYATPKGQLFLMWFIPLLWIIVFAWWTIDRRAFRKPRQAKKAKTALGKVFYFIRNLLYPTNGGG